MRKRTINSFQDGQSAFNIVRFLRKLAASGQAILCTIHQPNAMLFDHFDRLLLLQSGGQTVYFGDIGENGQTLIDYLGRNGAKCPPEANPAEFMLEAIGSGSGRRIGPKDWAEVGLVFFYDFQITHTCLSCIWNLLNSRITKR